MVTTTWGGQHDAGSRLPAQGGWGTQRPAYVLRLCISGMTRRSRDAVLNLTRICERHLTGNYELEIIDLYQQPELAARYDVIATPTLLKEHPLPSRHLLGDLHDAEDVLRKLGIANAGDRR